MASMEDLAALRAEMVQMVEDTKGQLEVTWKADLDQIREKHNLGTAKSLEIEQKAHDALVPCSRREVQRRCAGALDRVRARLRREQLAHSRLDALGRRAEELLLH